MRALDGPDGLTLAEAADANFVAHASWAAERVASMHARVESDLVLVDSRLACDTFNVVCRARLSAELAPARVREAVEYFGRVGRPFSWWVGPADRPPELGALLMARGLQRAESELAMAARLAGAPAGDCSPGGLDVRRVRTADELRDFARVSAANWAPPDPSVFRFYEAAAPVLLAPGAPQWFYVGYLHGAPVATAELTIAGGVIGLYNIATLERYRRRGFGTAMTIQPLRDAFAEGHRTAVLQAADAGVAVYRRVGFEPFGEITEYKPG